MPQRQTGRNRVCVAVLAISGAAVLGTGSAVLLAEPNGPPEIPTPQTGRDFSGPPLLPAVGAEVGNVLRADPLLRDAPWIFAARGSHRRDVLPSGPSLVFPQGTSYAEALTQLFVSVAEDGRLPPGTKLDQPLPSGKVVSYPAGNQRGVRVSLVYPFSYDVKTGAVLTAGTRIDRQLPPAEIHAVIQKAWSEGRAMSHIETIDVPVLDPCQVMTGDAASEAGPPC